MNYQLGCIAQSDLGKTMQQVYYEIKTGKTQEMPFLSRLFVFDENRMQAEKPVVTAYGEEEDDAKKDAPKYQVRLYFNILTICNSSSVLPVAYSFLSLSILVFLSWGGDRGEEDSQAGEGKNEHAITQKKGGGEYTVYIPKKAKMPGRIRFCSFLCDKN